MAIRSNLKSEAYFEKRIKETQEFLIEDHQSLNAGEISSDRQISYKRMMATQHIQLAIAKFSAGLHVNTMKQDISAAVNLIGLDWPYPTEAGTAAFYFDSIPELYWILSVAILQDFEMAEFTKIVRIIDGARSKDWLLEYLISSRIQGRSQVDTLIFPKPYASLKKAVEETDPAKCSAIVKHYLEKEWYPGHKGVYWHDNHKSKHDTFFGYWSFEAAAVVKIAGIDDTSFRDNEYYPKDLV
ncbi:MAG: PoNe immunity protein domain-containing protein [Bacteroidota bacterium]